MLFKAKAVFCGKFQALYSESVQHGDNNVTILAKAESESYL